MFLRKKIILKTRLLLFLAAMILPLFSCSEESPLGLNNTSGRIFTQFELQKINEDTELFEDRVLEVRMLAFAKYGEQGKCIYNSKLVFDNNDLNNPSHIVSFASGEYDLIFIANESAYAGLPAELNNIKHIGDLNKPFYSLLPYTENFSPGESAPNLFLMSALYTNVNLPPGSEATPTKLYVSLVRAFSKVEIVIKSNLEQGYKRITNIDYINIPSCFTLPGAEALPVPSNTGNLTSFNIPVNFSDENYHKETDKSKLVGKIVAYIPEFLREKSSSDGAPSVRISGVGIDPETVSLTIKNKSEMWDKISDMSIPGLSQERFNSESVVRNLNYRITCLLTESIVDPNSITIYTDILPFEDVFIEDGSFPGIVNVDRRVVELYNNEGALYFNFVSADTDASSYMEYVKSSLAAGSDDPADDLGFTFIDENGKNKLLLKFEENSPALENKAFYLHFRNKKTTDSSSNIIIRIALNIVESK